MPTTRSQSSKARAKELASEKEILKDSQKVIQSEEGNEAKEETSPLNSKPNDSRKNSTISANLSKIDKSIAVANKPTLPPSDRKVKSAKNSKSKTSTIKTRTNAPKAAASKFRTSIPLKEVSTIDNTSNTIEKPAYPSSARNVNAFENSASKTSTIKTGADNSHAAPSDVKLAEPKDEANGQTILDTKEDNYFADFYRGLAWSNPVTPVGSPCPSSECVTPYELNRLPFENSPINANYVRRGILLDGMTDEEIQRDLDNIKHNDLAPKERKEYYKISVEVQRKSRWADGLGLPYRSTDAERLQLFKELVGRSERRSKILDQLLSTDEENWEKIADDVQLEGINDAMEIVQDLERRMKASAEETEEVKDEEDDIDPVDPAITDPNDDSDPSGYYAAKELASKLKALQFNRPGSPVPHKPMESFREEILAEEEKDFNLSLRQFDPKQAEYQKALWSGTAIKFKSWDEKYRWGRHRRHAQLYYPHMQRVKRFLIERRAEWLARNRVPAGKKRKRADDILAVDIYSSDTIRASLEESAEKAAEAELQHKDKRTRKDHTDDHQDNKLDATSFPQPLKDTSRPSPTATRPAQPTITKMAEGPKKRKITPAEDPNAMSPFTFDFIDLSKVSCLKRVMIESITRFKDLGYDNQWIVRDWPELLWTEDWGKEIRDMGDEDQIEETIMDIWDDCIFHHFGITDEPDEDAQSMTAQGGTNQQKQEEVPEAEENDANRDGVHEEGIHTAVNLEKDNDYVQVTQENMAGVLPEYYLARLSLSPEHASASGIPQVATGATAYGRENKVFWEEAEANVAKGNKKNRATGKGKKRISKVGKKKTVAHPEALENIPRDTKHKVSAPKTNQPPFILPDSKNINKEGAKFEARPPAPAFKPYQGAKRRVIRESQICTAAEGKESGDFIEVGPNGENLFVL